MAAVKTLWTFRTSPFAAKVRIALAEKGLTPADVIEVHPVPAKRPPELAAVNPLGKVPTLVLDDGTVLHESTAICEWLEETHQEPALWPADPGLRAYARAWLSFVDRVLCAGYHRTMRDLAFGDDERKARAQARLGRVADAYPLLEDALGAHDGPWLAGAEASYADLAAMPFAVRVLEWTAPLAPDPQRFPRVDAWFEALRARPSAAAVDQKGRRLDEAAAA